MPMSAQAINAPAQSLPRFREGRLFAGMTIRATTAAQALTAIQRYEE
jgi:hypothetical protein